jgi:hypothetical protein
MSSLAFAEFRTHRVTVSVAAFAFALGWLVAIAAPAANWTPAATVHVTTAAHVDEANIVPDEKSDYFPARFPAPKGPPAEPIATF